MCQARVLAPNSFSQRNADVARREKIIENGIGIQFAIELD
jgi:hypothetical protein